MSEKLEKTAEKIKKKIPKTRSPGWCHPENNSSFFLLSRNTKPAA